jgi:hypothetical protein
VAEARRPVGSAVQPRRALRRADRLPWQAPLSGSRSTRTSSSMRWMGGTRQSKRSPSKSSPGPRDGTVSKSAAPWIRGKRRGQGDLTRARGPALSHGANSFDSAIIHRILGRRPLLSPVKLMRRLLMLVPSALVLLSRAAHSDQMIPLAEITCVPDIRYFAVRIITLEQHASQEAGSY